MTTSHDERTASTQPRRDDDITAWIKARRDAFDRHHQTQWYAWDALDDLLDEWRLLADTGKTVAEALSEDG